MFRVEDYIKDNNYVVRAELPGMDPGKDIEITVAGGTMILERRTPRGDQGGHRSEFRYGLIWSVALPDQADTEHITATYDKGILEVRVPVPEEKAEGRRIAITKAD